MHQAPKQQNNKNATCRTHNNICLSSGHSDFKSCCFRVIADVPLRSDLSAVWKHIVVGWTSFPCILSQYFYGKSLRASCFLSWLRSWDCFRSSLPPSLSPPPTRSPQSVSCSKLYILYHTMYSCVCFGLSVVLCKYGISS